MTGKVAICKLNFYLGETYFSLNTIISEAGALVVFDFTNKPAQIDRYIGVEIPFLINKIPIRGVFQKEKHIAGEYFSVRFEKVDKKTAEKVKKFIAENGAKLPPRRQYPRLDARATELEVPLPLYAIWRKSEETRFFSVINFTLGGLLVETILDERPDFKVMDEFIFDLYISDGSQLSAVKGTIVRINQNTNENDVLADKVYRFGIKMDKINKTCADRYKQLIRDYCLALTDFIKSDAI